VHAAPPRTPAPGTHTSISSASALSSRLSGVSAGQQPQAFKFAAKPTPRVVWTGVLPYNHRTEATVNANPHPAGDRNGSHRAQRIDWRAVDLDSPNVVGRTRLPGGMDDRGRVRRPIRATDAVRHARLPL